jgi:hypothetical protein
VSRSHVFRHPADIIESVRHCIRLEHVAQEREREEFIYTLEKKQRLSSSMILIWPVSCEPWPWHELQA